jgi:hypothetical protein
VLEKKSSCDFRCKYYQIFEKRMLLQLFLNLRVLFTIFGLSIVLVVEGTCLKIGGYRNI